MFATKAIVAGLALTAVASTATVASAASTTIDFEDAVHGERIRTNRYESLGVKIKTENWRKPFDIGVAFNTEARGTADPDLQTPFDGGNIQHETLGNILIIQEHNNLKNGISTSPDDEGGRPAGAFIFNFIEPVVSFGFDVVDVEGPDEYGNGGGFVATFYKEDRRLNSFSFGDFITPGTLYYDASIVYGNNSANRLPTILASDLGVEHFDRVEVSMGGSGGIDNIRFDRPSVVPTPSAALGGLGMLGLGLLRRSRKSRA